MVSIKWSLVTLPRQKPGPSVLIGLLALSMVFVFATVCKARNATHPAAPRLERLGPKNALSVYWVGHSLMNTKADTPEGVIDLMSLLGTFAQSKGLDYEFEDHTLWGTPLSANWRGQPHGYKRDARSMVDKRRAFELEAAKYDTLVLTEGLPLPTVLKHEFSAHYVRRFYCTLKRARPKARVYLFQSWVNLQGGDPHANYPPAHEFDWRTEMVEQRKTWEKLADEARRPVVRSPGWLSILGMKSISDAGCKNSDPIYLVPVGQTFLAIAERLARPRPADDFVKPDGSKLKLADLFSNPFINWPQEWPLKEGIAGDASALKLKNLKLAHPSKPHDDIHPSATGIYVSALVHFATLYRRSPMGLPPLKLIGDALSKTLQCIAWETVLNDPRSGVKGDPSC